MHMKFIDTPLLRIAYEEHGNLDGIPVILLHGFPYDIRSWDGVVSKLTDSGNRILVPYLRGYGPTRFLSEQTPRMAQQSAIANDLIDFAEALEIKKFLVSGFDWGNRAACIAAILRPDLVAAFVSIGGYAVQDTVNQERPSSAAAESRMWYQWYFNLDQGRAGLTNNRKDIIRFHWETWSPSWNYSDEVFNKSADSFDNPDFVEITLHSYRHRHRNAPGDPILECIETSLSHSPTIEVPTVVLRGGDSGFGRPSVSIDTDRSHFTNLIESQVVDGGGHDLPVQKPSLVSDSIRKLITDHI